MDLYMMGNGLGSVLTNALVWPDVSVRVFRGVIEDEITL